MEHFGRDRERQRYSPHRIYGVRYIRLAIRQKPFFLHNANGFVNQLVGGCRSACGDYSKRPALHSVVQWLRQRDTWVRALLRQWQILFASPACNRLRRWSTWRCLLSGSDTRWRVHRSWSGYYRQRRAQPMHGDRTSTMSIYRLRRTSRLKSGLRCSSVPTRSMGSTTSTSGLPSGTFKVSEILRRNVSGGDLKPAQLQFTARVQF